MKLRTGLFLFGALAFLYLLFSAIPYYWIFITANFIFMYSAVAYILMYLEARKLPSPGAPKSWPTVSVIIPSFNSGASIEKCLQSVKAMKYPKPFEVIVVDDGSTDGTYEKASSFEGVKVIRRPYNSGKASALNDGIAQATGELVACIDSDTYPEPDVLEKLIPKFENKKLAASTVLICAQEKGNLLQRLQEIEYYIAFGFWDKCLSLFDGLIITPGPMSMYRRKVLLEVGGFDETNITEDMEIALRLQERGYKVGCTVDARVHTEVPSTLRGLFRQRVRWYRGKVVNGKKYSHMLFNPKFSDVGLFVFPYSFVVEFATLIMASRTILFYFSDFYSKIVETLGWLSINALPRVPITTDYLAMQSVSYYFLISLFVWGFIVVSAFEISRKSLKLSHLPTLAIFLPLFYLFTSTAYFVGLVREVNGSPYKW